MIASEELASKRITTELRQQFEINLKLFLL